MTKPLLDPAAAPVAPAARQIENSLFVACALSWCAGLIHVVAAIQHVDEYALYAVFFVALAAAQFAWGVAVYRSAGRRVLLGGAAMSLMVLALWVVSRTSGLPIGPQPWTPEPIGTIDVIASADELVLVLLVCLHLARLGARLPARAARFGATAAGLWLILLSSLAMVLPLHAH